MLAIRFFWRDLACSVIPLYGLCVSFICSYLKFNNVKRKNLPLIARQAKVNAN
ncbi:MAG: hypothetical protein LBP59_10230 [Planctomycetaceae bacterium]|nr:hypothetical protein [Planctomycetaceae bacterium]